MNLYGEYITHKVFGKGQITAHEADFVIVLFNEPHVERKFMFPSAIETFLKLENAETVVQFKAYTDELLRSSASQRDAAERLELEKNTVQKQAKAHKKTIKKPKPK